MRLPCGVSVVLSVGSHVHLMNRLIGLPMSSHASSVCCWSQVIFFLWDLIDFVVEAAVRDKASSSLIEKSKLFAIVV